MVFKIDDNVRDLVRVDFGELIIGVDLYNMFWVIIIWVMKIFSSYILWMIR